MEGTTLVAREVAVLALLAVGVWLARRTATTEPAGDAPDGSERTDPAEDTAEPEASEPVEVETFLRGYRSGLARYQEVRKGRIVIRGTLFDVSSLNPQTAWIGVRHVDGLEKTKLVTASIEQPSAEAEAALEAIGRNGAITLEGIARATPEKLALLHMGEVVRINGQAIR